MGKHASNTSGARARPTNTTKPYIKCAMAIAQPDAVTPWQMGLLCLRREKREGQAAAVERGDCELNDMSGQN